MKKIVFVICLLLMSVVATYAQAVIEPEPESSELIVDLGTFTGIVAVISFLVTQLSKIVSFVQENKWVKIAVSVFIGAGICSACWATGLTPFLSGLTLWQVLIYGAGAGLSGCGLYDIVKPILDILFRKNAVLRLD